MKIPVGLLQVGNFAHAGAAPRSPEIQQDVFVRRVLDHRSERYLLAAGIGLCDVDERLADVGFHLLFGVLLEFHQRVGLLHGGREFGDFVEQLLSRKLVAELLGQQHHAEEVVAVLVQDRACQLFVLLLDGLAALGGGFRIAELLHEGVSGRGIGVAGVVGRRARHLLAVGILCVVGHVDRARFEDQHGAERRSVVAGVAQNGHLRVLGHALEAERTVGHGRRIEDVVLLVEKVNHAVGPFDLAVDGVLVFVGAAAQHGGRRCEDQDFFHRIIFL